MDGTCKVNEVLAVLQTNLAGQTTWADVRAVVRAWAAEHQFLPCTTTPTATGLRIAYYDEAIGCITVQIVVEDKRLASLQAEYEAGNGDW